MRKLLVLSFICALCCAAFSLLNISIRLDISILAPVVGLIFTAFFIVTVLKANTSLDMGYIPVIKKCLEYAPFVTLVVFVLRRAGKDGTPYILDVSHVALWLALGLLSIAALRIIHPKHIERNILGYADYVERHSGSRPLGLVRVGIELLGWVDALVQAIFMVMLVNIFILQLYEIPSESMVPEFLVRDRVIVFKTLSAPKFPLSNIGFPPLYKYKRGDIVVFRNPHYSQDRKSEVKTVVSQLVYMCTLTAVNLNTDNMGNPKADPLVKRVCGVGGEQLVMQDGVLYKRSMDRPNWEAVDEPYASYNLNSVKGEIKRGIKEYPISEDDYNNMLKCEEARRAISISQAKEECEKIVESFASIYPDISAKGSAGEGNPVLDGDDLFIYNLLSRNETFTRKLITTPGGLEWFRHFMLDWTKDVPLTDGEYVLGDIYNDACYRLNLMAKLCVGRLYLSNARLIHDGVPPSTWSTNASRNTILEAASMLNSYLLLQDRRNFGVFPSNTEDGKPTYIPDGNYFMMGDNRFNSLDMRHSYSEWLAPLTLADKYSVRYLSNLDMQYVSGDRILGTTTLRFWPLSRMGIPGRTGI